MCRRRFRSRARTADFSAASGGSGFAVRPKANAFYPEEMAGFAIAYFLI
jgi:hypothetical protein